MGYTSKTLMSVIVLSTFLTACGGGSSDPLPEPTPTEAPTASDPLLQHQWYIVNTGQSAFAGETGTAGEDNKINVVHANGTGTTGSGVKVAVVDTGLDIHHTDLAANIIASGSWDFVNGDNDPTPAAGTDSDHGTMVGGIIAMKGWNNIGGRGVAPNASLAGFNFLENQSPTNFIDSLGGAKSASLHVFNQSYGRESNFYYNYTILDNNYDIAQYRSATAGTPIRDGKGAIFIKSSGNGFSYNAQNCGQSVSSIVSCFNSSATDYSQVIPYQIVVAALNASGVKSSYSTAGSSVWIAAAGGEYGLDSSYGSVNPFYANAAYKPAMVSTDVSGCTTGKVKSSSGSLNFTSFETGSHAENPNCDYVSTMNGTSSAAPVTSGIVALMLQANPNLTWRDVKHILAATADQVDASIAPVSYSLGNGSYIAEPAWITNAAGYKFHNWYGFGRANAERAVAMAKSYSSYLPATGMQETVMIAGAGFASSGAIPDNSTAGVSDTISVSSPITKIESVQIQLDGITHDSFGELGIELISPSGTRSVLLPARNVYQGLSYNNVSTMLASNAFYGENPNGTWTVKVVDAKSGITGTITRASIRVYGH